MWFAKLHPLLVHFPVALFTSGVLFEIYGRIQKEEIVVTAGQFNIRFGFVWALVTGTVGFLGLLSLEVKDNFRPFVSNHVLYAFLTLFNFALALLLHRWRCQKLWVDVLYHLFLVAGLCTTLATGYYGGELVHRFGVTTLQPVD